MLMKLTIVHLLLAWSCTTAFQIHHQKQKLLPTAFLALSPTPQFNHGNADHAGATRTARTSLLSTTINASNDNRAVLMNAINNDNNGSNYENYGEPIIDRYGRITWTKPRVTHDESAKIEAEEAKAAAKREESARLEAEQAKAAAKREEAARIEAEEAKAAAKREEAARVEAEQAKAAAEREEAARVEAEQAKAAAEREEAARIEAEAKAAAEREEAARVEAETRAAAEREEAARIEAETRAAAEREEAARVEAEAQAAAEREEAARVEAEQAKAAAEREEAARIEAEAKTAAEREEAARIEADTKAAAEREEAARIEADTKAAAEREEAPAIVEEQLLKSIDEREDSSTIGEDNMLGGLMSSIEKKLREENVGLGLKRTDFAPPIPPPPDVGVDKTGAVALKRSKGAAKKPASFVKAEATSSNTGKLENFEEKPEDKKITVLSMIKGKKDSLLRIAKEKPKLVSAAALVLVLVPSLFGTILRGSMR